MGFDITILDEAGRPKSRSSLDVEEHWAIVQQANQLGLSLWKRMSDYYEDADYKTEEVVPLSIETARLVKVIKDEHILSKLKEIECLLKSAIAGHSGVSAIAD